MIDLIGGLRRTACELRKERSDMAYLLPQNVTSAQHRLSQLRIIHDDGEASWAVAEFTSDGKAGCIGMRWNGTTAQQFGNPISNNQPTWFVLPDPLPTRSRAATAVAVSIKKQALLRH